jgi:hypothetical protein
VSLQVLSAMLTLVDAVGHCEESTFMDMVGEHYKKLVVEHPCTGPNVSA